MVGIATKSKSIGTKLESSANKIKCIGTKNMESREAKIIFWKVAVPKWQVAILV